MQHAMIINASVVGLKEEKYGEVVAAFLQAASDKRPSTQEVRDWIREKLARHKAPDHVFWIGDDGVGDTYPLTGSGKVKKNVLRELGESLLERPRASKL